MSKRIDAWEAYELQFLSETYPSKEWSVLAIAQKLDRSIGAVHQKAWELGVKRPPQAFAHSDHPEFIRDVGSAKRIREITDKWGCSKTMVDKCRAKMKREAA